MLAVISHPACRAYDPGSWHPDRPERLDVIFDQIIASGLEFVVRHYDAPKATRAALEAAHDPAYVAHLFDIAPSEGFVRIDEDTVMTPEALPAALRSAGAAVMGVDLVMRGEANSAFCAVRPPGHHAERARGMGFCFFNNIAVGAHHAMMAHGLKRVAIVDFDVHHGNGTEDIFHRDDRVLLCSSFQHPFYPHTGHASDTANLVAVPLPDGTGGPAFRAAVEQHWLPALEAFAPELVMISAGFDAHQADDMSGLMLTDADYVWISEQMLGLAQRHAQGRIVSVLEGGYALNQLGRSVVAHVKALIG